MQQLQNRSGRQIEKALVVEVAPETARSTIIRHRLKMHDRDWNDSSLLAFGSVLLDEQLVVQRPSRLFVASEAFSAGLAAEVSGSKMVMW